MSAFRSWLCHPQCRELSKAFGALTLPIFHRGPESPGADTLKAVEGGPRCYQIWRVCDTPSILLTLCTSLVALGCQGFNVTLIYRNFPYAFLSFFFFFWLCHRACGILVP